MAITIHCQCSREIKVSEALAGQPTRCPSCGRRHIVPQVEAVARPAVAPLSEVCCRECNSQLLSDAQFCHACGLPAQEPRPVTVVPVQPQPQQNWYAPPQQPQAQPQYVAPPQPQPAPAPAMRDPFAPAYGANQAFHQARPAHVMPAAAAAPPPQPAVQHQQQQPAQPTPDGPFARAAAQRRVKPNSPLGNVAMACAYMAILLGLVSIAFAVPIAHALGCHANGSEAAVAASVNPQQAQSLVNLQKGILALMGIFTAFGMLMGFLGLFHGGHKKSGAFWGLVLCFLIGAMAAGATNRLPKIEARLMNQPAIEMHDLRDNRDCGPCPFQSFGPRNGNSEAESTEPATDEEM